MNLSRVLWTVLPFSSYNLQYRVNFGSILWQIVIFLSEFVSASNILPFVLWTLRNVSESSFNLKVFPASLRLGHLHAFHHSHFISISFLSLRFSGCTYLLSSDRTVNTAQGSSLFSDSIYVQFEFLSSIITFSLLHFHLCWLLLSFKCPFL